MLLDSIGLLGVGLILLAYLLLQTGRIKSEDLRYSLLNLVGALLIIASLMQDFNLPSFVMETAWVIISLIGLWRWFRSRSKV